MSVPNVGKTHYRSGGTRGGAEKFNWDDVKSEKYRENYLGHSLKAPVGRWCQGKDLNWWSKEKNKTSDEDQERIRFKEELQRQENELIAQALGLAPDRKYTTTTSLDAAEIKRISQKGQTEYSDTEEDRVAGLGQSSSRHHDFVPMDQRKDRMTFDAPDTLAGTVDEAQQSKHMMMQDPKQESIREEKMHKKSKRKKEKKSKKSKNRKRDEVIRTLQSQLAQEDFGTPTDSTSSRRKSSKHRKRSRSSSRRKKRERRHRSRSISRERRRRKY